MREGGEREVAHGSNMRNRSKEGEMEEASLHSQSSVRLHKYWVSG